MQKRTCGLRGSQGHARPNIPASVNEISLSKQDRAKFKARKSFVRQRSHDL